MDALADTLEFIEGAASYNQDPQWIADQTRQKYKADFGQLAAPLEARIAKLSEAAEARPEHKKLNRGIGIMRKVVQLLDPAGAEAQLEELAERIRVCVAKSDNYAATAGKHLREARDRCRQIGMNFNTWCAQANLGIKRARVYQLMGPDPIAAERQGEKHKPEPENVQSIDIAQLLNVEPIREDARQEPLAELAIAAARTPELDQTVALSLRALPFDEARAAVTAWFAELTVTQQNLVLETLEGANDADLSHDTLRIH